MNVISLPTQARDTASHAGKGRGRCGKFGGWLLARDDRVGRQRCVGINWRFFRWKENHPDQDHQAAENCCQYQIFVVVVFHRTATRSWKKVRVVQQTKTYEVKRFSRVFCLDQLA